MTLIEPAVVVGDRRLADSIIRRDLLFHGLQNLVSLFAAHLMEVRVDQVKVARIAVRLGIVPRQSVIECRDGRSEPALVELDTSQDQKRSPP